LRQGSFVITLWKDWLTDDALDAIGLNDRQHKAVVFLRMHGKMSNADYRQVSGTTKKTATRDLDNLVGKGIVERQGTRGPSVQYVLKK